MSILDQLASESWIQITPKTKVEAAFHLGRLLNLQTWLLDRYAIYGHACDDVFACTQDQIAATVVKMVQRARRAQVSDTLTWYQTQWKDWFGSPAAEIYTDSFREDETEEQGSWDKDLKELANRLQHMLTGAMFDALLFGIILDRGVRRVCLGPGEKLEDVFPTDQVVSKPRLDLAWLAVLEEDFPSEFVWLDTEMQSSSASVVVARIDSEFRKSSGDDEDVAPDDQPMKPGYLELLVNHEKRTVAREDVCKSPVQLTEALWHIFLPLFEAEGNIVTTDVIRNKYPGESSGRHTAISALRAKLKGFGVAISRGPEYRLVKSATSAATSDGS